MSQKLPNVHPIGRRPAPPPAPPAIEFHPRLSAEGLDIMIDVVVARVLRAREQQRPSEPQ